MTCPSCGSTRVAPDRNLLARTLGWLTCLACHHCWKGSR